MIIDEPGSERSRALGCVGDQIEFEGKASGRGLVTRGLQSEVQKVTLAGATEFGELRVTS